MSPLFDQQSDIKDQLVNPLLKSSITEFADDQTDLIGLQGLKEGKDDRRAGLKSVDQQK